MLVYDLIRTLMRTRQYLPDYQLIPTYSMLEYALAMIGSNSKWFKNLG